MITTSIKFPHIYSFISRPLFIRLDYLKPSLSFTCLFASRVTAFRLSLCLSMYCCWGKKLIPFLISNSLSDGLEYVLTNPSKKFVKILSQCCGIKVFTLRFEIICSTCCVVLIPIHKWILSNPSIAIIDTRCFSTGFS